MKLFYSCTSCKKVNPFSPKASDRGVLQMRLGNSEVQVNCQGCGKREKIHLNKIYAAINYLPILIAVGLSAVVTLLLLTIYGAIGTVTMSIPVIFWLAESNAANTFNKFLIRRR